MQERIQQVRERVVYYWPTYGPPILGALLVLLALFVGYRILNNRSQDEVTTPAIPDTNLSLSATPTPGLGEPNATVTLPAGAPTPTQAPIGGVASDTVATTSATTKGGQTLPETGFPVFLAIPAFSAVAFGGFKLSKAKKS
ncbi:MAG: hypothetical protein A3H88_01130 [Candidatus Blackburnbacteria bacterium RIFCSPLOWO2_02_FULL_44_9]|nr:MAG: hypothetical protein A3H88_01130 [Candidatus Blackburnbacteria bacterium RIFCSPLOWO2_02_FULL_44_9]